MKKFLSVCLLLLCLNTEARVGFQSINKTLTTATVAERLTPVATKVFARSLIIQNNSAVTVYIGDSTVTVANGIQILAGQSITLPAIQNSSSAADVYDSSEIYGVSGTNGSLLAIGYPVSK